MARIRRAKQAGAPGIKKLRRGQWPKVQKPMRKILSVRTLRKVDEAKGLTMPESRNLLQRNGVGSRQQGARIVKKANPITTSTTQGRTRVRTPRPATGGVRSPFRKGKGT